MRLTIVFFVDNFPMKRSVILLCAIFLSSCASQEQKPISVRTELVDLARAMEQDPQVSRYCHDKAHDIGHAAYDALGLKALEEHNDICGSGYFHGVIERHFATGEDVLASFQDICAPLDGRCFHGLGHGLMFATDNDLPHSIALCSELTDPSAQIQCAEGVFMENFNTNEHFHTTEYRDARDPYFPCGQQEQPYKSVCTFYAVRYFLAVYPHDNAGVTAWCATLDADVQHTCYKGVGSALTKYFIDDSTVATSACDRLTPTERLHCYRGIVSYTIVHYASPDKGQEWCATLEGALQKDCMELVEESRVYY